MRSIKQRVFIALITAGLVPVAIMLLVNLTVVRQAMIGSEKQKLRELSDAVSRQLSGIMTSAWSDLEVLRSNPDLIKAETPDKTKKESFDRLKQHYEYLSAITLLDTMGWPVNPGPSDPTRKDQTAYFKSALMGEDVVSQPEIPIERGIVSDNLSLRIMIYLPIIEPGQDKPHNVVRAEIRFDKFWEVTDNVGVGDEGFFAIVNYYGNTLAHYDRERILRPFAGKLKASHWTEYPEGVYEDEKGISQVYLATPISAHGDGLEGRWILLCFQPESEVYALAYRIIRYVLAAAVAALAVAALVGLFLAKGLAAPIIQASVAAQGVARGELETVMPESGVSEMRGLAISFNKMVLELKGHRTQLESLVQSRTRRLKESQADLEDLTAQLRAAYESTREAVIVVRPSGEVLAANQRIQDFFGLSGEKLLQEGLAEGSKFKVDLLSCFDDQAAFEEVWTMHTASADIVYEAEWEVSGVEQMQLSVYTAPVRNSHGKTFARLWMFRDMTEQRRLEQGLQQAQKMEAIGRLSGGVAHDFNNLLTGIIGNLSLSELNGGMPKPTEQLVLSAKRAAERAAGIVKQLLTFSRQSKMSLKPWSANQLVEEVKEIMLPGLDPSITLAVDLDESDPYILADGNQIDQVLMNFCVNARDALPDGGCINVSTSRLEVARDSIPNQVSCEPGGYVKVSVKDTGVGMDASVLEKIFEPFFTTKEQGKGTGLGLATSYGIVQEHAGWIECESEFGNGTTFTAYIPACDKPHEIGEKVKQQHVRGGDETILVVDDESMVRCVAEGVLARQGYKVMTARDGMEALEIVAKHGDSISLIMLDLTMPRLSGRETFRELRSGKFPFIPVVICSGYLVEIENFDVEEGLVPEGAVQKPYQVDLLAVTARSVIDEAATNRVQLG